MHEKLVNIHIPKTAGTSLRYMISEAVGLTPQTTLPVIGVDSPDTGMSYFEGLAAHAKRAFPKLFQPGVHMLSGHFRYRDILQIMDDHEGGVSLITFLRDPIKRTISDYCYSVSAAHEGQDIFVETYPTFEHYIQNAGEMNKQLDFLRPFENASLDQTISNALEKFDFIGSTDSFESNVGQLFDCLSIPRIATQITNTGPNLQQAEDVYKTCGDMLQDVLEPDLVLYKTLIQRRRFPR